MVGLPCLSIKKFTILLVTKVNIIMLKFSKKYLRLFSLSSSSSITMLENSGIAAFLVSISILSVFYVGLTWLPEISCEQDLDYKASSMSDFWGISASLRVTLFSISAAGSFVYITGAFSFIWLSFSDWYSSTLPLFGPSSCLFWSSLSYLASF